MLPHSRAPLCSTAPLAASVTPLMTMEGQPQGRNRERWRAWCSSPNLLVCPSGISGVALRSFRPAFCDLTLRPAEAGPSHALLHVRPAVPRSDFPPPLLHPVESALSQGRAPFLPSVDYSPGLHPACPDPARRRHAASWSWLRNFLVFLCPALHPAMASAFRFYPQEYGRLLTGRTGPCVSSASHTVHGTILGKCSVNIY